MENTTNTPSILSVRVSAEERTLLETAAQEARTSLSDFVRRKALDAAEIDILARTVITIPAEDWDNFEKWVNRPAEVIPGLKKLATKPLSWEA